MTLRWRWVTKGLALKAPEVSEESGEEWAGGSLEA